MWTDLRHAFRFILQNPGFAIAAAATLSLGIGANAAMFTVVYEVLLRPLPYEQADRLVKVWETYGEGRNVIAPANFADWQARSHSFEQLGAYVPGAANLSGVGDAERIPTAHVTANFFEILKVRPVLGRPFGSADESANSHVALVRESFWRERLGSDPGIVGRVVHLDGVGYAVVGVIPDHVEQPARETMIWRPLFIPPQQKIVRGAHYLFAIGRLKDGVSVEQADAELRSIAGDLARRFPQTNSKVSARAFPLQEDLVRNSRTTVLVIFWSTGLLLLLACVNVAHLLLARGSARQLELAVRAAIGASRWRLLRQLLAEGLVIALIGAVAGLLIAMWTTLGIRAFVPDAFADARRAQVNAQVLAFTVATAAGTVILFGLLPAVRLSRVSLASMTRTQATQVTGRATAGRSLVVLQVALAVVLVIGAGLLVNTLLNLRDAAPGFASNDLIVARVALPAARYETGEAQRRFFRQLIERLEGVSGIEDAAVATRLPLRPQSAQMTFTVDTQPPAHLDGVVVQQMSPKLLDILRIGITHGRPLTEGDSDRPHALVSRTFAMRTWGTADVLGRRFRMGPTYVDEGHPWMTVVGITEDVPQFSVSAAPAPQVYVPYGARETSWAASELVVRSSLPPVDAFKTIRAAVREIDPDQPLSGLSTMELVLGQTLARPRFTAMLIGTFAALALTLAVIGIYGVISYSVTRRVREIGIRVALGAKRTDVLRLIAGEGLVLVGLGLVAGAAGGAVAAQSLRGMLFGVRVLDPATYASAAAVMLVTAMVACLVPTFRATRVDPASVLRAQ